MMPMFTNREKLAAVLSKWAQPAFENIASGRLMQLPFFGNIEAKIKSTGWVSPMWSLGNEIAPLLGGISNQLIEPFIGLYLQGVPDESIPQLAHTMVENAINNNGISLFEGNIIFERDDLEELKKLLMYNLPVEKTKRYEVVNEPNVQGEDARND